MLQRRKIKHVVLDAKYHEREADIVAQAGRKGAVTIATNMAGRGTDIVLGGNPEGLARMEADPGADPEAYETALAKYSMTAEPKPPSRVFSSTVIIGRSRRPSSRAPSRGFTNRASATPT